MSKQEFLYQLEQGLMRLDEVEKDQFIHYYDELIEDYLEEGVSEEEAVKKLGKPSIIASKILEDAFEEGNIPQKKSISPLIIALLILGFPLWGSLLLAAMGVVLSGYIVIWCLPFSTGILAIASFGSSVFSVFASVFALQDGIYIGVTQLGVGTLMLGISILCGLLTFNMTTYFIKISRRFSNKIVHIIKAKELLV